MKRLSGEPGYLLVDVIVGLVLFGFVLLSIYHLYGPTFVLSQIINDRLSAQQDVRLALDRVARALHETASVYGRLRVYSAESGCHGAYEGCLGFVTARDSNCTGTFQLIGGAPNWQATLYLWRDVPSDELRLRCEPGTTFPAVIWPLGTLEPFAVVGSHIVAARVTLQPVGSIRPTSVAIALREQLRTTRSGFLTTYLYLSETFFLPQNR